MIDANFRPGYMIRGVDSGWGVYLVVDAMIEDKIIVSTKDTWIATFATLELAEQYTDLLFKKFQQRG